MASQPKEQHPMDSTLAMEQREAHKIEAMRERKEERRRRFLDARQRTIGVRAC